MPAPPLFLTSQTHASSQGLDFTSADDVAELKLLFEEIEAYPTVTGTFGGLSGTWYDNYAAYLTSVGEDVYGEGFQGKWADFLASDTCGLGGGGGCHHHSLDVVWAGDAVAASRFYVAEQSVRQSLAFYAVYEGLRDITSASPVDAAAFHRAMPFAEGDDLIYPLLVKNLLVTMASVSAVLLVFTDVATTACTAACLVVIDVSILAFSSYLGCTLSVVYFTCLIMSVGLSVDYCLHIAHGFEEATRSSAARVRSALEGFGPSVLKGALTTFLGILLLRFTNSSAFRLFFTVLFLTVVFGLVTGLLLLPVLMSLVHDCQLKLGGRDGKEGGYAEREGSAEGYDDARL